MRDRQGTGVPWWHGAAGYQVYLPSFADGDGDGLGDLAGLHDGRVPRAELQDPLAVRTGDPGLGRDQVRTPMPWRPGPGLGFTTAARAWLPDGGRPDADTVAAQRAEPASTLHRHRELLAARHAHLPATDVPVEWLEASGPLVAYRRGRLLVVANCGDDPATLHPPVRWQRVFATDHEGPLDSAGVTLQPDHAVMLRLDPSEGDREA